MRLPKYRVWTGEKMIYLNNDKSGDNTTKHSLIIEQEHWSVWNTAKKPDLPHRVCGSNDRRCILLQYTGLNKKHKGIPENIYEGDILQDARGNYWWITYRDQCATFRFSTGPTCSDSWQSYTKFTSDYKPFKVVGHIFDGIKYKNSHKFANNTLLERFHTGYGC